MRELKFRAWDKKLKRMVYRDSDFGSLSCERSNKIDQPWDNPYEVDEWYPATAIRGIFDYFDDIAKDDNFIIEQYTGLKDKNGTEIYEGDIVSLRLWGGNEYEYENGIVRYYQPSAAFKWFSLEDDENDCNNYWLQHVDDNGREVVGNIHENHELLEVKQ